MSARWLFVALAALLLSGCFKSGGDEQLAQPTDRVQIPTIARPSPPTPTAPPDLDDPGYILNGTWHVGDEWDYRSNNSAARQLRVAASFTYRGLPHFILIERTDRPGQIPTYKREIVQAKDWLLRNTTDDQGIVQEFSPGVPLRQANNSTYFYNVSAHGRNIPAQFVGSVAATTRFPTTVTLQFPWGFVEAARIEHRVTLRPPGSQETQRTIEVRFPAKDYLNDVQYSEGSDVWKLVACQVGDFRRGTLFPD